MDVLVPAGAVACAALVAGAASPPRGVPQVSDVVMERGGQDVLGLGEREEAELKDRPVVMEEAGLKDRPLVTEEAGLKDRSSYSQK
ncbi:hypothetical protein EYF80_018076 [Liparis tanakae]|uniref:Uncharacterized protein n=1 Tax=Liparis tanakae TaxID=230148 RepID=A0A4Z2I2M9_9TELE|nr:hypothetical protein EYF80_018076 [Liparis tanakae]